MFTYRDINHVFGGIRPLLTRYSINAIALEYRSSIIEGLPKLEFLNFNRAEDLDLMLTTLRSSVLPPQFFRLENIERIKIAGKKYNVAKVRAIYGPS